MRKFRRYRKIFCSPLAVVGIALCLTTNASSPSTKPLVYAEQPFQTAAIEPARVVVESVAINNWLNANHSRLTGVQIQGAREHLHALIDSRVKELYWKNNILIPHEPDPLLAMLYSWAGQLGVYGADAVYATVRGNYSVEPPPGPRPPEGLDVALQGETLVISSSEGGWQASVPYHFFIFVLDKATGPDSRPYEATVISTGSAPVVMPPGYSQATLAIYFTEGADMASFEPEWCERLQIPCRTEQEVVGQTRYRSRKVYDERTRLHKEVAFVPSKKGGLAILYAGLDGTYQLNRPHYLDFLERLKVLQ